MNYYYQSPHGKTHIVRYRGNGLYSTMCGWPITDDWEKLSIKWGLINKDACYWCTRKVKELAEFWLQGYLLLRGEYWKDIHRNCDLEEIDFIKKRKKKRVQIANGYYWHVPSNRPVLVTDCRLDHDTAAVTALKMDGELEVGVVEWKDLVLFEVKKICDWAGHKLEGPSYMSYAEW